MSLIPENRVPFPKPENYNEKDFELLFRNFEAGDLRIPTSILMMPNGKTDTNNTSLSAPTTLVLITNTPKPLIKIAKNHR